MSYHSFSMAFLDFGVMWLEFFLFNEVLPLVTLPLVRQFGSAAFPQLVES